MLGPDLCLQLNSKQMKDSVLAMIRYWIFNRQTLQRNLMQIPLRKEPCLELKAQEESVISKREQF